MLAIGRALMAEPRLLLLVEQNARMALAIASRAYVMEMGQIALTGSSSDLAGSPHVKAAYLGGSS
jgi:branched-chain amino acid transport system ATP-binding protein